MIKLPEKVIELMNKFQKNQFKIYVVGGALRNLILGKEVKNWDFATDAKPEEIIKLLPQSFYNNKFGTVTFFQDINGIKTVFEITTFRKESEYKDFRHPEKISWANNIEEDLARRDLLLILLLMMENK